MGQARGKTAPQGQGATGVRVDGRRLRTQESRRRVVAALLQCVREGDYDPSAEAVALRAGVGLRTVFRLFKDKDGLMRQMSETVYAELSSVTNAPFKGDTWRERLDDLIRRRVTAFEQVMSYRRAALAHVHHSPVVQLNNRLLQAGQREGLVAVLPERVVAQTEIVDALDLALCIDSWIHLRMDRGIKPAQAKAVVKRLADALLAGEPD
ncbi:MAG: TetR/AcrR family transcriptional regulator [Alphaproteobacteria bacterium]|jgi:AcrR family transcriptional regulator|nr:TetR/AcrR family transcriptional regulator [Alphaproteobacteria bacterium]